MKSIVENKTYCSEILQKVDLTKTPAEKFAVSLANSYPEDKEILKEYEIEIKKPCQWIVLTINPELLKNILQKAKDLEYIDGYKQNPRRICYNNQKLWEHIKDCEANSLPYVDTNGKYQSWIFGNRPFDYVASQLIKKDVSKSSEEQTPSVDYEEAKEYAKRVMEIFALESEAPKIYTRLGDLINTDYDIKSILMELFKEYANNLDYLSTTIDEILNIEENKGSVTR